MKFREKKDEIPRKEGRNSEKRKSLHEAHYTHAVLGNCRNTERQATDISHIDFVTNLRLLTCSACRLISASWNSFFRTKV